MPYMPSWHGKGQIYLPLDLHNNQLRVSLETFVLIAIIRHMDTGTVQIHLINIWVMPSFILGWGKEVRF
jgi:hypothetical protein